MLEGYLRILFAGFIRVVLHVISFSYYMKSETLWLKWLLTFSLAWSSEYEKAFSDKVEPRNLEHLWPSRLLMMYTVIILLRNGRKSIYVAHTRIQYSMVVKRWQTWKHLVYFGEFVSYNCTCPIPCNTDTSPFSGGLCFLEVISFECTTSLKHSPIITFSKHYHIPVLFSTHLLTLLGS